MNIKQTIANRITESRKQLGITIKELAARTGELSAARISNWEQGTRSPGPVEAKMIAGILNVSPSYLLCLSDDPRGDLVTLSDVLPRFVPLIPLSEVNLSKNKLRALIKSLSPLLEETAKISLDDNIKSITGPNTFATNITDSSMSPDFNPGDIIIADPDKKPKPGQYVIAHIKASKENIIRKYRESGTKSAAKSGFELVALNSDWGTIQVANSKDGVVIATVVEHRRVI